MQGAFMAAIPSAGTAQWSSRFAFIMAAVGSSVGLGNLWRFSAEAGSNGGGAFIIVYLLCVIFIGIPLLMSEFLIGRGGQASSAVKSVEDLAVRSGKPKAWSGLAWIGMLASFLIVSFYCVVAAWVLAYIPKFLYNRFEGQTPEQIANMFGGPEGLLSNPGQVIPYFIAFALMTIYLVSRGVNKGIELAAKYLMPLFFMLLIGLAIYSLMSATGDSTSKALSFLFQPDFSKINGEVAVAALGQAFFSIGVGSAIMITYGSYLPKDVNIPKSAVLIGLTDTFVAIIAGLAIFPIVFTHGLDVASGGALFFVTLPNALADVPLIGAAFFFLAFFAAITSSVSLLEPSCAWVSENFKISKAKATWLTGIAMVAVGAICIFNGGFLDFLDGGLTGPIMLPLCGLLVVLFVGWGMTRELVIEQIGDTALANGLFFLVRFVAPFAVFIVLVWSTYSKYFAGA